MYGKDNELIIISVSEGSDVDLTYGCCGIRSPLEYPTSKDVRPLDSSCGLAIQTTICEPICTKSRVEYEEMFNMLSCQRSFRGPS